MLQAVSPPQRRALAVLIGFHVLVIIASNYLVQLPVEVFGWQTTWGAFSFPLIFLSTDLTVRLLGKSTARRVIAFAMLPTLLASYLISALFQQGEFHGFEALLAFNTFVFRISLASFLAYVIGQLLDIQVFDRLRRLPQWWIAPTASTIVGGMVDTFVFFSVAFWRSSDEFMAANWVEIGSVDYCIKLAIMLMLMVPLYGMLLNLLLRLLAGRAALAAR